MYCIYNRLYELYGNIIYQLLADGIHSKEEYDFYKIIKFYLPHTKIKLGYKIKYGKNNLESYIYDICIDNKLIIEYDGDGYYHQGEKSFKRDKNKEILAINNNFIFLRISLNEALNPNTIIKIKKPIHSKKKECGKLLKNRKKILIFISIFRILIIFIRNKTYC